MRRALLVGLLAVGIGSPLVAETGGQLLRTHVATLDGRPENVARTLLETLPPEVTRSELNGAILLGYAGLKTPPALVEFLTVALPALDPESLSADRPVSLSVALLSRGTATEVRLMLNDFADVSDPGVAQAIGPDLPDGTRVILNDGANGLCIGQFVLSHDASMADTVTTFTARIKAAGYKATDASDATTSFLIGNRPDCDFFMYIQPDPDAAERSVVVVRYLED